MKKSLKQAVTRGIGIFLVAQTSYSAAATTPNEGVAFSIRWDSLNSLYRVYMRPNATPVPDVSTTAQVTIVAPYSDTTSLFIPSSITSLHDGVLWSTTSKVYSPSENPTKAYLSFTAKIDLPTSFQWKAGVEQEVFNFKNGTKCLGVVELMNNDTDPFNRPEGNSHNTNPGNQFSNTYWGDANDSDYLGNYGASADCRLSIDTDGDGLADSLEINTTKTDPLKADTDGDGINDKIEVGVDLTKPLDTDLDGKINALDTDDDNDGLLSFSENYNGGTPIDDDSDKDGKPDYLDTDDDNDGLLSANESNDPNKNGLPDDALDTDKDGLADYRDAIVDVVALQMRVMLQGAFSSSTLLMRDDLRVKAYIPTKQPYTLSPYNYTGTELSNSTQLAVTGNNAPVDWVLIELRSNANSKTILQRKAALVQRDGDVVEASTGSTTISMPGALPGSYYVAIRHRNHLGVMTASALSLKATPTLVDFTTANTVTYGSVSGRVVLKGISLLWAGDANRDSNLISNGVGQDTGPVYSLVLSDPANILFSSNFVVNGYHTTDFTMDGQTIFTGPNNDVNLLSSNVLANPGNLSYNANYIVRAQLP